MTNWEALVGEAMAPFCGPFPRRSFLEVVAPHSPDEVVVISTPGTAAAFVCTGRSVRFLGEHHLTDYHSPLGSNAPELAAAIGDELGGMSLDLDSLPAEAADPLEKAFASAGLQVVRTLDEDSCRVLDLGDADPEAWEAALRSKDRHEVRRKRRRYEESRGEVQLGSGPEYLGAFVALHRRSAGDKGGFMTQPMEEFFADLIALPEARLDALISDGDVIAAVFGFVDQDGYYLYNSAFDRDLADLSPGIILIDRLIGRTASAGLTRFDFLKGSEDYKRRLGAIERPLYRLEVAA